MSVRDVYPRYFALFAHHAGMRSSEALKCLMLAASVQSPPDVALRDTILALGDIAGPDREYLVRLADLFATTRDEPVGDPLDSAALAVSQGRYDRALDLLRRLPSSSTQVRLLCECAVELGTLDARSAAVDAVNTLDEAERSAFLRGRLNQHLWSGICDFADEGEQTVQADAMVAVPTDWLGWLEHLDAHDGRNGTRELAHRGSIEWDATALLATHDAIDRFAERLYASRSTAAEQALRDCLPYLLACFHRDERWPNPAFRPVYRALSELLHVSTAGCRSDLSVYGELIESLISLGVSEPTEYGELVTTVMELWSRFNAPSNFDWGLDMLSMLIVQPCADPEIRLQFLDAVLQGFHRYSRHVRPEHWALMELLAADLGALERVSASLPSPESVTSPADDPLGELSRASVAFYSLTESALRQVKRILEDRSMPF